MCYKDAGLPCCLLASLFLTDTGNLESFLTNCCLWISLMKNEWWQDKTRWSQWHLSLCLHLYEWVHFSSCWTHPEFQKDPNEKKNWQICALLDSIQLSFHVCLLLFKRVGCILPVLLLPTLREGPAFLLNPMPYLLAHANDLDITKYFQRMS